MWVEDFTIKPEYKAMAGTTKFREVCGNYVVRGVQYGREFYGTVSHVVRDTITASKLDTANTLEGSFASQKADTGVQTLRKVDQNVKSDELKFDVRSSGIQK